MNPVESYIYSKKGKQQEILIFFHELFTNKYQLIAKRKWGIPVYSAKQMVFYLNPDKKTDGIHICFYHGIELAKNHSILEIKGRKLVSSILISDLESMSFEALELCIEDALEREKLRKKFFK